MTAKNVLGTELVPCSMDPLTGYFRDGCCRTNEDDEGLHVICARMNDAFLEYSLGRGNDLISPRPEFDFPGLIAGDKWCLCATRWRESFLAGCAPRVVLESTHEKTLEIVSLEDLQAYAWLN